MALTLVGVFDEYTQAQQARQQLLQEGLDDASVRLSSSQEMQRSQGSSGEDHRGFFARLFGLDDSDAQVGDYSEALRRGSAVVSVQLQDESRVERVSSLLRQAGAIDIDRRVEQWKAGGYEGYRADAAPYTSEQAAQERDTFKVMEEQLKVGKREVELGGVRVHRRVSERPVNEQVTLREQRAVVDRRPVDRPATESELDAAFAGSDRDIELRETAEEAVVSKSARVVEEVSVGLEESQRTETINETLRRTDVDIEQVAGDSSLDRSASDASLSDPTLSESTRRTRQQEQDARNRRDAF